MPRNKMNGLLDCSSFVSTKMLEPQNIEQGTLMVEVCFEQEVTEAAETTSVFSVASCSKKELGGWLEGALKDKGER